MIEALPLLATIAEAAAKYGVPELEAFFASRHPELDRSAVHDEPADVLAARAAALERTEPGVSGR